MAAALRFNRRHYFGGSLEDLRQVSAYMRSVGSLPPVPVLRKDFIFDPYQLYEARAAGAAAVLLITAALSPALLNDLYALAGELGLAALVEVHQESELEVTLGCQPRLVGINNRDLHTFTVDLSTTLRLRPQLPAGTLVVAESGIRTADDVACLAAPGVDGILVGEAIVSAPDPGGKVRELSGRRSHECS
jgi:indole-3-glycerol phosphate synthase